MNKQKTKLHLHIYPPWATYGQSGAGSTHTTCGMDTTPILIIQSGAGSMHTTCGMDTTPILIILGLMGDIAIMCVHKVSQHYSHIPPNPEQFVNIAKPYSNPFASIVMPRRRPARIAKNASPRGPLRGLKVQLSCIRLYRV